MTQHHFGIKADEWLTTGQQTLASCHPQIQEQVANGQ